MVQLKQLVNSCFSQIPRTRNWAQNRLVRRPIHFPWIMKPGISVCEEHDYHGNRKYTTSTYAFAISKMHDGQMREARCSTECFCGLVPCASFEASAALTRSGIARKGSLGVC